MLRTLFRKDRQANAGEGLYAAVAAQARRPEFYTRLGVEDRIDARFELYTLHMLLLNLRLRDEDGLGQPGRGAETAQSLFDAYVSALDNVLRELGVSDVSVARKMRKLGEALYGRMTAYEASLRADAFEALAADIGRNVYGQVDEPSENALALARYAVSARDGLAGQAFEQVLNAPTWPEIVA